MKSNAWAYTQRLNLLVSPLLLYSDPSVRSLLPNVFSCSCVSSYWRFVCYYDINKMKLEYFAHARGNNLTYQCNGIILYIICILNHYYLNNLGNQRGNWINNTRCITVVRRDTQKCCTKHNQGKLKRVHALTYITGRKSNTRYLYK